MKVDCARGRGFQCQNRVRKKEPRKIRGGEANRHYYQGDVRYGANSDADYDNQNKASADIGKTRTETLPLVVVRLRAKTT